MSASSLESREGAGRRERDRSICDPGVRTQHETECFVLAVAPIDVEVK